MRQELLLQWASEQGEGSWDEWQQACAWANPQPRPFEAYAVMRTMSTLAHLEIDWDGGSWTAAPTVLTLLPDAGGHGLITGARTGRLTRLVIHELTDLSSVYVFPHPQQNAPDACFVEGASERDLIELANLLGIPYEHSVADRLTAVLPSLDAMLLTCRSTPGVRDLGVERLAVVNDRWDVVDDDERPGLYRYERPGRRELRWIDDGGRHHRVDYPLGVYCELRREGLTDRLKWYPDDAVHGALGVPVQAPLPALPSRAAALCSGLAPERRARVLLYRNVPQRLARRIAASIGQQLVIVGAELGGES